jgi:hypothetical protein
MAEHAEKWPEHAELVAIKNRLRAGKIEPEDLRQLQNILETLDRASKALRVGMIE